jgi:hypothetical protein
VLDPFFLDPRGEVVELRPHCRLVSLADGEIFTQTLDEQFEARDAGFELDRLRDFWRSGAGPA